MNIFVFIFVNNVRATISILYELLPIFLLLVDGLDDLMLIKVLP